jgi:alkanesulfonate monooxygenase SsuD/methylene tetrahydromethanopterin reductase-like flavin-dependent oxidoreductase (luciferase family)
MLRLAGAEADGVLLNYLPASHVPWCVEQVRRGGNATIYANIHVGAGDRDAAAQHARYDLFSYAVVDAYARSFTQAGFGDAVQESGPPTRPETWSAPSPPCPTRWSTRST